MDTMPIDSFGDPDDVPPRLWTVEEVRAAFKDLGPVLALHWTDRMPTEVAVLIHDMRTAAGRMTIAQASALVAEALAGTGWGQDWVPDARQIRRAHKTWYSRTGQKAHAIPNPAYAAEVVIDPDAAYEPVREEPTYRWRDDAACRTQDPELFFPIGTTGIALLQTEEAKAVCRRCEVVNQCYGEAAEFGIWGATDEDTRRRDTRRAQRAARKAGQTTKRVLWDESMARRTMTLSGKPRPPRTE